MKLSQVVLHALVGHSATVEGAKTTAPAPKLNITTSTVVDGSAAIQCWQIDLPSSSFGNPVTTGYSLGNFENTTLFATEGEFEGTAAASYSLGTIIQGSITYADLGFTLRSGRNGQLLTSITNPKPSNGRTIIRGPFLYLQQYTHEIPPHTVLHDGECKDEDLPN
ncbi:hypothetical protein LIA77_07744 [Sarocladium implicatum]|nr:hypothetical protein LIA77_07744 [Sarocladium implicatum]